MLLNLRIRDFAIIDAIEVELPGGFTVLTGETGAGKSILVDALSLALGGRASAELVREGAEAAEVEALFDISGHPEVQARLEQRDLVGDDSALLLVRRVVGSRGRAKVLVNGRLSTVATLAELVRGLVDISGQHEQQSLLVVDNHLGILDAFGQLDEQVDAYRTAYEEYRRLGRERDRLARSEAQDLQRADFLRFQLEEIERLAPRVGEDVELEAERERLAHADKLRQGAQLAEALLYGDDGSAFDKLGKAAAEVAGLARIDAELGPTMRSLDAARHDVQEAARDLQRYADRVEVDPGRLEDVDGRLVELRRLCRKHGSTLQEVVERERAITAELEGLEHADARLAELEDRLEEERQRLLEHAQTLTSARQQVAAELCRAVEAEVADMDLPGAVFRVMIRPTPGAASPDAPPESERSPALGPHGADDVELLWSANRGESPRPLAKIASGGELSRLMLAVKRVLSSRDLVSLYVFDEVDAGLGGRAADSIGRKIQAVAADHQAIAITHLAPIAARADHHIAVRKQTRRQRTVSVLEVVSGPERTEEIARMIGGANISVATRRAATDMLAQARLPTQAQDCQQARRVG